MEEPKLYLVLVLLVLWLGLLSVRVLDGQLQFLHY